MYPSNCETQITPKIITANGYIKRGFDSVKIDASRKESKRLLIESIKILLARMTEYHAIKDALLNDKAITFDKRSGDNLFYVSRSSLSNYIGIARKELGLVYKTDKEKILELFDAGISRKEMESRGDFKHHTIYAALISGGRIPKKHKKT